MEKKIEQKIKKADQYVKGILNNQKDDSVLSQSEKDALKSLDGTYQSEREKKLEAYNQQENWKLVNTNIRRQIKRPIYKSLQFWHSAAAVLFILVLCGGAVIIFKDFRTSAPELVQPGKSMAYLEVNGKKKIDLTQTDTLLLFHEAEAQIDSGRITYTSNEGKLDRNEYHKINVPRNGEYYVVLSDGTKVWVNADSQIGFYSRFEDKKRIVELQGEAYFEVAKDENRPFIVKTNNIDVRVLGTHFNVKAYTNEDYTYTTLSEGKVVLKMGEQKAELIPDQQIVLNNQTGKYEQKNVDASIYTAWKDGKFIFRDETLENIMSSISRWYDVEVFYPNQDLKKELFSMRVDRYDNLEVLLKKMEKTGALRFNLNKKALIVK
ncbi:FecR domain-containing protein [Marinifilum fragile]|uniref:FecR family protein n=1 Tax=Marinifilum fragile TaxID=570161 RepID=UPI002AABD0F8|nr:FecR domain-containing protein [Marinifilum fragile]